MVDVQVEVLVDETEKALSRRRIRSAVIGATSSALAGALLSAGLLYDLADHLPGVSFDPDVAIGNGRVQPGGHVQIIGANFKAESLISVDVTSKASNENENENETFIDVCGTQVPDEGAFVIECELPINVPVGPAMASIRAVHPDGSVVEYEDFTVVG